MANKEAEINRLASELVKLVEIFRSGKHAGDLHYWQIGINTLFRPYFGYQKGKALFEDVVQSTLKLNPEMLSEENAERQLVDEFLQKQNLSYLQPQWLYGERLMEEARKNVSELVDLKETHYIEIPIYNLMLLKNEQYNIAGITLRKATETDAKHYNKEFKGVGLSTSYVHSFACIQVEGDKNIAISDAITKIRRLFDLIRTFCFPFGKDSEAYNTGIFGDIPLRSSIPMIIDKSQYPFKTNQRNQQIELETHILSKLTDKQWVLLDSAIKQIPKRLSDGIHWLAEATKPDTNNAKFIKISIALETLLGKEPKDENLKVRGITAMLAERAAFIAGEDCDDRSNIDKKIRTFYKKRSGIVHGEGKREKEVSSGDIDEFGNLVRRISLAIIEEKNIQKELIENSTELEDWMKKQKYTLPENKEVT